MTTLAAGIIGFVIGGLCGVVIMCLMIAGKDERE
jgi:tetrahydromethanopterin S-methyltransferase subunit F